MSGLVFTKATKEQARLRLAIYGPSGAGKTFTALRIATGLGGRIAVIDTERGSASKYADKFEFDVLQLPENVIDTYVEGIKAAAGYNVLIIDSLSHAWRELLSEVDRLARAKYNGNTWSAWSEGTPKQNHLIDALLDFDGHVIATMRSKTEWVIQEDSRGKKSPRRIGTSPEQGKGIEYEFDLLIEISADHVALVTKDRTGKFQDSTIEKPGEDLGKSLAEWLSSGAAPAETAVASEPEPELGQEQEPEQRAEPLAKTTAKKKAASAQKAATPRTRPYTPDYLREKIVELAAKKSKALAPSGLRGMVVGMLEGLFAGQDKGERVANRHRLTTFLLGKDSSNKFTEGECQALMLWARVRDSADLDQNAIKEAAAIVEAQRALEPEQEPEIEAV